jgi:mono/diheme cytochrome c family protein
MTQKQSVSRSYENLYGLSVLLTMLALLIITLWVSSSTASALPEYTVRTGESCAACHVNAGGSGPRTLRGLIWAARGRPDQIPELPGVLIAPRVTDPAELYEIACGGCHGYKAEGLSAMGLANTRISQATIRSFTVYGIPGLGMPGFEGQFTNDQLEALIRYVAGLSNGEISPPSDTFDLPLLIFRCSQTTSDPVCGDHIPEIGGN